MHKAVENIVRKGEIAFLQCFLPYMVLIFHFKCTLKCRLQFVSILKGFHYLLLIHYFFSLYCYIGVGVDVHNEGSF